MAANGQLSWPSAVSFVTVSGQDLMAADRINTMFSIPRTNVIASDEGFTVELLGQTGLRYTEGSNSLWIDCEVVALPSGLMVYSQSLRDWDSPVESPLDDAVKDRILSNIREAFRFRGFEIEVA
jgi:hypothetical protein